MRYLDLLGIPYRENGRDPSGLDCWGLCMEIYRRRGIKLPDYDSSGEDSLIAAMIKGNKDLGEKIEQPEPWCFALFRIDSIEPTHIGIVLQDCSTFIHVFEKRNVIIERLDHVFWKQRREGFYTWKS